MLQEMIKKLRGRKSRTRRYRVARRMFVEPLEDRRLMTADLGGNSLGSATDLGNLEGTRQVADYVGLTDRNDYFRVRLNGRSDVRLNLDGLSADADLELLNRSGVTLARSVRGGNSSELISRTLDAGEYVVRAYRYRGNTNYRLTLSATPNQPSVPDYAGNSLAQARDLGTLSGSTAYQDFVGQSDNADFYRFRVNGRTRLQLGVEGMSADGDVELLDGQGRPIAASTRGGSSAESIERVIDPGEYFVRVYPYGGANTNYRLTLRAESEGPADQAGNSMAQARDLGTLSGSVTMQDFVGQGDGADFYRFRVTSRSNFRLRMDGMSADADIVLLDSQGRQIASSTWGGANPEAVDRVIESGDYFAWVYAYGSANTNYRLSLEATVLPQGLDLTTMTPIDDYDGHLGADYPAEAGTPLFSPVSGRVVDVRPVDGYGTMAVAIDVDLPTERIFATELAGSFLSTNRVRVIFGHLRPSRELITSTDAAYRFQQGRNELTYSVGSYVSAGQLLGYVETHGYEGDGSTGSHVHVTASDAHSGPANYWQGRGMPENDARRGRYIRPELSWSLLR
ncbi:MAG: pre-peptidase C-terminal domain-containing protein [Planctomycetia bacterium]|nr:pre-peptidase C-terminal domain-containing protein [Planctomycetia bacterium]